MELAAHNFIETARFVQKYKAQPKYMNRYSRDYVHAMIDFFEIPDDIGDCENCRVVDWLLDNDITGYLALGNKSYIEQVDLNDNVRVFRKACQTC